MRVVGRSGDVKRVLAGCLLTGLSAAAPAAADTYPRQPGVDALHYVFRLTFHDGSNAIEGESTVRVRFVLPDVRAVFLDLASPAGAYGMTVTAVSSGSAAVSYTHAADRLRIVPLSTTRAGDEVEYTVRYPGIPASGLRIGTNIHKGWTIFSEN